MAGWHQKRNGHELGKLREMVRDREAWHVRHDWVTEQRRQQYR